MQVFLTSLHAFMLRELKNQFGRLQTGYFWAFAEPAAMVAIFTILHAVIRGGHAPLYGDSPIIFFVFGAVPYFIFTHCVQRAQGVCESLNGLFNYRQIKPVDVVLARCIIDALLLLGVTLIFLAGWVWLGEPLRIQDPLLLLASMFSLFVLGASLGLLFEVYGTVFQDLKKVFGLIMRPMLFISGVFYTIEMVPQNLRVYLLWNPALHGIDLVRDAVLHGYTSPASMSYLWLMNFVLAFSALSGYRRYLSQLI
ncbi:MAG: ABC transporter permease [Pseudomonadota bacterium]|nr:ABC transporter permease [Pseudomonadota bacterium]